MDGRQLHTLLRHLYRVTAPQVGGLTDAELLERFAVRRDEAAFEVLVRRHAALVFNTCRRVLPCLQDAEDAFQATFLLLIRKAGSIRRRETLSGWLHRVAQRIAWRARARAARHKTAPYPQEDWPAPEGEHPHIWADVRPVLDEEVSRLPTKYRLPVILCYLEGQSTEEAARQLGCPRGTVLSRLAWARERLRVQLTRRGITLSAGTLAALLTEQVTMTASDVLIGTTVKAAVWLAAGKTTAASEVLARAVELMKGVARSMYMTKVKLTAVSVLVLGLLGGGMGLWNLRPVSADGPERHGDSSKTAIRIAQTSKGETENYAPPRPLGDWERIFDSYRITLCIKPDHMQCTVTEKKDGNQLIKLRGDCAMTKDSVLYGVITDLEMPGNESQEAVFLDQPFSIRFRVEGSTLVLGNLKLRWSVHDDPDVVTGLLKFTGEEREEVEAEVKYQEGEIRSMLFKAQGHYRKKSPAKEVETAQ